MTVNQIVVLHRQGLTVEEIVARYPQRTLSEIYTALAWYYANKEAFDKELADEAAEEARLEKEMPRRA